MHDETDDFFRTALDGLDDVPPPGAAFDANALWRNLDAELRPRRRVAGWWVAAGVSLLVLAGAGWWLWTGAWSVGTPTTANQPPRSVAHRPESAAKRPSAVVGALTDQNVPERSARTPTTAEIGESPRSVAHRPESVAKRPSAPVSALTDHNQPEPEWPVKTPTTAMELPEVPQSAGLTEKIQVESAQTALASRTAKTKPRFRVVPENELRVAEEARPKLYRPEGTARVMLGFPTAPEPQSADRQPYFILSPKPN